MENKILDSIKKAVNSTPIDILNDIKETSIPRMTVHDEITMQTKEKRYSQRTKHMTSLVAVLTLVFGLYQYMYRVPYSFIYLDINPSIEIIANKREKVIKAIAHNSDGVKIIEATDLKGKDIVKVTEEVLKKMTELGYINSADSYLLVSVRNKNLDRQNLQKDKLNTSIHNYMNNEEFIPIVLVQDFEVNDTIEKYAKTYGISLGKMTFIKNIIDLNSELEIEDLSNLSLKELIIFSQGMKINLEDIIYSDDFNRIPKYIDMDDIEDEISDDIEDEISDDATESVYIKKIISKDEVKKIALSITRGGEVIYIDFDIDDDSEAEYEVKIKNGNKSYEIEIDAYTGKVLDIDIDEEN